MKTVTIKQVSNGYLIECDGETYVAKSIESYSYSGNDIASILKAYFEPQKKVSEKTAEPAVIEPEEMPL